MIEYKHKDILTYGNISLYAEDFISKVLDKVTDVYIGDNIAYYKKYELSDFTGVKYVLGVLEQPKSLTPDSKPWRDKNHEEIEAKSIAPNFNVGMMPISIVTRFGVNYKSALADPAGNMKGNPAILKPLVKKQYNHYKCIAITVYMKGEPLLISGNEVLSKFDTIANNPAAIDDNTIVFHRPMYLLPPRAIKKG